MAEVAKKEAEMAQQQEDFARLISEGGELQSTAKFEEAEDKFKQIGRAHV